MGLLNSHILEMTLEASVLIFDEPIHGFEGLILVGLLIGDEEGVVETTSRIDDEIVI